MLDAEERRVLLRIARVSIETVLNGEAISPEKTTSPALQELRASFVTLRSASALRGCIGTLEAVRPLAEDVAHNARAAAFRDPRFPALQTTELSSLRIEVSILETPVPFVASDRHALLEQLRPGEDGLIVEADTRRATFLPSVWESLPDPGEFVTHLWKKAGLAPESWPADLHLSRYGVEHFAEIEQITQLTD